MTKKPKNKTQRNESVVANVISIDLLLNISWKVNQARWLIFSENDPKTLDSDHFLKNFLLACLS